MKRNHQVSVFLVPALSCFLASDGFSQDCVPPPPLSCTDSPQWVLLPGQSIQLVIDLLASPGDTIWLTPSDTVTYGGFTASMDLKITKRVECPPNPLPVIIDGSGGQGPGITVDSGAVVYLEGLTVRAFDSTNVPGVGGGLEVLGASVLAQNCAFESNRARKGGGARVSLGSACFLECSFTFNDATTDFEGGGAILAERSSLTIDACTIEDNTSQRLGGGVSLLGDPDPSVEISALVKNSLFQRNHGGRGIPSGGAIGSQGADRLRVERTVFFDNDAGRGGAIDFDTGQLLVDYCEFRQNEATDAGGGGLTWIAANDVVVRNSLFEENSSEGLFAFPGGGAILALDDPSVVPTALVKDCLIVGNDSRTTGGGIALGAFATGDASMRVETCTIDGNHADETGGGISNENLLNQAELVVTSTILNGNSASNVSGGGVQTVGDQQVYGLPGVMQSTQFRFNYWAGLSGTNFYSCSNCQFDPVNGPAYDTMPTPAPIAHQPNVAYYLAHDLPSICVDKGDPSLTPYVTGTTRDDGTPDNNVGCTPLQSGFCPDIGFHYGAGGIPTRTTTIAASSTAIPEDVGGSVTFTIETDPYAGPPPGEILMWFLASVTGTSPAVGWGPGGSGPFVPLVATTLTGTNDPYYKLKLTKCLPVYTPSCAFFFDNLDDGAETVTLSLTPSQVNVLRTAGVDSIWHAALIWEFPNGFPNAPSSFLAPSGAVRTDLVDSL